MKLAQKTLLNKYFIFLIFAGLAIFLFLFEKKRIAYHHYTYKLKIPRNTDQDVVWSLSAYMAEGINVYTSYSGLDGCILFKSSGEKIRSFPGEFCQFVPGLGLVTGYTDRIILLDPQLNPIWEHHTADLNHDLSLSRERREIFYLGHSLDKSHRSKVCSDVIVGLNFEGQEIFSFDLINLIGKLDELGSAPSLSLNLSSMCEYNYFHTNSVSIVPSGLEKKWVPHFEQETYC